MNFFNFLIKFKILFLIILSVIGFFLVGKLYFPYLRTDVFRYFVRGNWDIISQRDTLFTAGYYGVRKYLVNNSNNLTLLKENDTFCVDRLFSRSISLKDDNLYVAMRSYLPGNVSSKLKNGELIILDRSTLSVLKKIAFDIKLVDLKIIDNYLVVSGLNGFNIFDCSNASNLKELFSYRHNKYREYQGFDFFKKDNRLYVAFSLFAEGLEIWDITNVEEVSKICTIPINEGMTNGRNLVRGQSMDVKIVFPFIFTPLGPTTESYNSDDDCRGLLVYDVSNLDKIKKKFVPIPKSNFFKRNTGDKQPTYLSLYKDYLYLNFAEMGVAVFDVKNPNRPVYIGTNDVSKTNDLIQPIYISDSGILFTGSYYWPKIHSIQLAN